MGFVVATFVCDGLLPPKIARHPQAAQESIGLEVRHLLHGVQGVQGTQKGPARIADQALECDLPGIGQSQHVVPRGRFDRCARKNVARARSLREA